MLFKGKSTLAKTFRLATNSPYDHIGIFMRDEDDMLFLVDANGANGVSAVSFEYFIANEWHTFQEKLVFRKLEL